MVARTHNAIAFASLMTAAAVFPQKGINVPTVIGAIIAVDIGALIPDMDTAGNRLWDLLPQGDVLAKFLRKIFYKHRTLTHSLIGMYALYELFAWAMPKLINPTYVNTDIIVWSLMIGIVSHVASDGLTEEGVPLLFPLRIAFGFPPIKKMRIKTGKWFEHLIVFPAVWVYVIWLVREYNTIFLDILRSLR